MLSSHDLDMYRTQCRTGFERQTTGIISEILFVAAMFIFSRCILLHATGKRIRQSGTTDKIFQSRSLLFPSPHLLSFVVCIQFPVLSSYS